MADSFQTTAYELNAHKGQKLKSCGAAILIKATSMQTGGTFNLFEALCLPDYATPLHIHLLNTWRCTCWKARWRSSGEGRRSTLRRVRISSSRGERPMDFAWKAAVPRGFFT